MSKINLHTIALEMEAAVNKLWKKYPKAKYISGNFQTRRTEWSKWQTGHGLILSVHHRDLKHSCVVSDKETIPECLADIHNQLKEFAHLLK